MIKYMGSKRRLAKHLLPIILEGRKEGQWYVEPFVGGANMIENVDGNRLGADTNKYIISMFHAAVYDGWVPPTNCSESLYKAARNKNFSNEALIGFIGIGCSYSGKWFGGYARGKDNNGSPRNYCKESKENLLKQSVNLHGVKFLHSSYDLLDIPSNSIIYCDPPYANSTGYKDDFDHNKFWQWCGDMTSNGHRVYVSEYEAPDDFECVWEKEIHSSLTKDTGAKKGIEKLFVHKSQLKKQSL